MKKFIVEITSVDTYSYTLLATSAESAEEKAIRFFNKAIKDGKELPLIDRQLTTHVEECENE